KHLGTARFILLKESQKLVCPMLVNQLLNFGKFKFLRPLLFAYKIGRKVKLDSFLKSLILPKVYQQQIKSLDVVLS
ncbi:MAG: DUF2236 domain-containing protein, partial [Bacteroidota bacterium]